MGVGSAGTSLPLPRGVPTWPAKLLLALLLSRLALIPDTPLNAALYATPASPPVPAGCASRAAPSVCVFIDLVRTVETSFLFNTVLGALPSTCGACLQVHRRLDFARMFADPSSECGAFVLAVSFVAASVEEEELAAFAAHPVRARERVVLIHHSDERDDMGVVRLYGSVRAVYRNYFSNVADRASDYTWLLSREDALAHAASPPSMSLPPPTPLPRVFWLPLGPADTFAPLPHLAARPMRSRPLSWSWAGSVQDKPARHAFLSGVSHAMPDALMRGRVRVLERFQGRGEAETLNAGEFAAWLHDSRLAPCPAGGSDEQFRVWEALSAGAIPIVARGAPHLRPLSPLGLRVLELPQHDWGKEAPPLLALAAGEGAEGQEFLDTLEAMRIENVRVLGGVYARMAESVAQEVCAAAAAAKAGG